MCGIAGFYTQQAQESSVIQSMTQAIAHRGPDADGFYHQHNRALGHRRLSIIDLSTAANQPMYSADKRWVIVFNGEVYNYQEVAKSLNLSLRTHSDTEVLLESFAQKQAEAISVWNGMFALALYDTLRDKLFLIRDRIGIKPLYYFYNNGDLFFASELKALFAVKSLKKQLTINQRAIQNFLRFGYIPGPDTIYNEVKKLPPGSFAEITTDRFEIKTYWRPEDKIYPTVISNETDARQELERLLLSSVKYRMIADVPYGTFLSGGIDSSLVTALAQKHSSTPVKTFSIAFTESKYNEAQYARAVSQHLKTDHHEYTVTENDALQLVETMLDAYDEPYADSSGIPTMLVSKLARQHVTMVLSGDGGDELFMGYGAYTWAERLHKPLLKTFHKPVASLLSLGNPRQQRAAKVFDYDDIQTLPEHIFSQEQYFFSDKELRRFIKGPLLTSQLAYHTVKARKLSPAEQQAFFDLKYYLCDDLLVKVDIASMQYALEVRVPLLDYRIVEFALNLDESLRKKAGITKYLLKQVLYDYVPATLFDRPKWGFSIPLPQWLRGELKYLIDQYLSEELISKHQLIHVNDAVSIRNQFLKGNTQLYNRVWALLILHRWMEKH